MSRFAVLLAAAFSLPILPIASGQVAEEPKPLAQLQQLFPQAASFSAKGGTPLHYKAFGPPEPGRAPKLLGFAYWTTDVEPHERGFDGPIKMLVALDTQGVIRGVIVAEHREPYGYFSLDLPEFPEQFVGLNVRDKFQVGIDVDAISRATITVTSVSRTLRTSSRQIARAYLTPPSQ